MLVDVQFRKPEVRMEHLLSVIGTGQVLPKRIGQGMYLVGHWSVEQLTPVRERWREGSIASWQTELEEYGVCDNPEQVVEKYRLRDRPEKFFVAFVRLRREDQPSSGGWRWHKWGMYIGDQKSECEYLHDEPLIEEVYTFQIYEPAAGETVMLDSDLAKINEERRRKGLPALTKTEAIQLVQTHPAQADSGFNFMDFLIGYETGIGFSGSGMVGAMLHQSPGIIEQHGIIDPIDVPGGGQVMPGPVASDAPDTTPSYSPPEPAPTPDTTPSYSAPDTSSPVSSGDGSGL